MVSKWAHQTNDRRVSTRVSGGSRTMKTSRWRKGDGEKKHQNVCAKKDGKQSRGRGTEHGQPISDYRFVPSDGVFDPTIRHQIQCEPELSAERTCSSPSRHLQQQIIPEPWPHQQPQPPNLIKSQAAEEAIVFMLDLTHARACVGRRAHGGLILTSSVSESKKKSRRGCGGACGSVTVRPHQIITFINGQMDF